MVSKKKSLVVLPISVEDFEILEAKGKMYYTLTYAGKTITHPSIKHVMNDLIKCVRDKVCAQNVNWVTPVQPKMYRVTDVNGEERYDVNQQ